ncbi:MAG TPA: hypothetical protein VEU33_09175, partial [Archangium sp.]|nr:hypothetical protein [Archangium sp.]
MPKRIIWQRGLSRRHDPEQFFHWWETSQAKVGAVLGGPELIPLRPGQENTYRRKETVMPSSSRVG